MTEKIKRIPYGISDFETIIKENQYFVDKTEYIRILEEHRYIFFIRPRRFWKSLWMNMLDSYYDVNKKKRFDKLFKETYIGRNPTDKRNSYKILKFDFSLVNPKPEKLEESFESYCDIVIKFFLENYSEDFSPDFIKYLETLNSVSAKLSAIFLENKKHKSKIYVLIDEYDNFTNTILAGSGKAAYRNLTHGEGFLRHFFAVLKGGTTQSDSGLGRLFITGVSPVTLDDVTSGI